MAQLNFSIALNLLTDKFNAGVKRVRSGFASIRMQVLTFVAALQVADLSISGLISKLIETARETNRAVTALKNISPTLDDFAKNQRWLIDLSEKYGTDVNTLTGEFAKFTAAGNLMNMPLADQRKIFEAVDRACTGFSLTAEDTNSVFLALTQMMGKGKIQAQELRLQMGEKLPVAINAMAMAAGGSLGNLDKLMKEGKLLSADVLPKFADALNKLIPNVNTDNLETSIKRMNNAFTMLVKNTSVQSTYKSLIDWITSLIKGATNNINNIINAAVSFLIGSVLSRLWKYFFTQMAIVRRTAKIEAQAAAKAAGQAFDEAAWKAENSGKLIMGTFKRIGTAIKSAFISILPMAIITGLSLIVTKIIDIYRESARIKGLFEEYQKNIAKSTHTTEIEELRSIQRQYNNSTKQLDIHVGLRNKINNLLGTNLKTDNEINNALNQRIGILEKVAMAQAYAEAKVGADMKKQDISDKFGGAENYNYLVREFNKRYGKSTIKSGEGLIGTWARSSQSITGLDGKDYSLNDIFNSKREFNQQARISWNARVNMDKYGSGNITPSANSSLSSPTTTTKKDKAQKESELQKIQEEYIKDLSELAVKAEYENISTNDLNKALDDLHMKYAQQAASSTDVEVQSSQFAKILRDRAGNKLYDASMGELEKVQTEYAKKVDEQKTLLSKGLISEDEYHKSITDLSIESAKSALSIKDIGDKADEFVKNMQNNALSNLVIPSLKDKKADTTFDYRKQKGESNEEELQRVQEYIQLLKDKSKTLGGAISVELDKAIKDATTEELSLKLNIVKRDIKDMQKELNRTKWEGIKSAVNGVENFKSSFENLTNVFKENGTMFERLMALWNTFASVIDTINSVSDAITSVKDITEKLGMAKKAEAAIEAGANATTSGAVTAAATTEVASKAAIAVANKAATISAQELMAAETAAAYASIPYVGTALAGSQIAAMLAMIKAASIPLFATGGIVGGSSYYGDNVIAGVNSGEMILNRAQQSNLFKAINSGKIGGSNVNIGFDKVRGSDIYLSLKNYLKSSGKKL